MKLLGIAWDHPRGIGALRRTSDALAAEDSDVVEWHPRSLAAFEETPIEELAMNYDLMAIDHPNLGDAIAVGAILPLGELTSEQSRERAVNGCVGPSSQSYVRDGQCWALPLDAACQVSAYRPDVVVTAPRSWDEVDALAADVGSDRVVIAGNPTHLLCTLISLCADIDSALVHGRPVWWDEQDGPAPVVVTEATNRLYWLLERCSPLSLGLDPIGVLDAMVGSGGFVYSPLVFGYVTYALAQAIRPLRFADAPSVTGVATGTVAGGVGLAVSARRPQQAPAIRAARMLVTRAVQTGPFAEAGGQPALRSAWLDEGVNARSSSFFGDTIATMERSVLRPTIQGYPEWQRKAGHILHELVVQRASSATIAASLIAAWRQGGFRSGGQPAKYVGG